VAWPEISIDDFPHRRDDEPSSLRQDILDELSDHFVCALNRELLKNPNEQIAKQRVITQFGDPVKNRPSTLAGCYEGEDHVSTNYYWGFRCDGSVLYRGGGDCLDAVSGEPVNE